MKLPPTNKHLQKLSEKLGPEYAMAVLQNRERDITLEKPVSRSGISRSQDELMRDRERDLERARDLERGR